VRTVLLFSLSTALVISPADQPRSASGTCVTPQGTLCRTIRSEGSGWENRSWGFHAVERWHGSTTLSYRRDGAWLERNARQSFKNYVVPAGSWDLAKIKLPGQNETIEIDHTAREYEIRSGVRGGFAVWDPDDADCAKLAAKFALSGLKHIGEVVIAGVRAIEYTGKRSSTNRIMVALAPSLGCAQIRYIERDYNRFGLPTSFHRFEAVSVQIGEPDTTLFRVPSGYRRVK
jgi:hypothetical protein